MNRVFPCLTTIACAATLFVALAAALSDDSAQAAVPVGPPTFTNPLAIDNAYHPFVMFRIRTYEIQQGHTDANAVDVFTDETRAFMVGGVLVQCACMEEWAIEEGEVVEISKNYFAQADDGTVYYFGETVDNYEDGVIVNHDGSWLVGGPVAGDPVDTATAAVPAVFMPGTPEIGDVWKPEDLPGAGIEEFVTALQFHNKLQTPLAKLHGILEVEEETPDIERKWYASGLGFAKSKERAEILIITDLIDSANAAALQVALDAVLDDLLDE